MEQEFSFPCFFVFFFFISFFRSWQEIKARTSPHKGKTLQYTEFQYQAFVNRKMADVSITNVLMEKSQNSKPEVECQRKMEKNNIYEVWGRVVDDLLYVSPCATFATQNQFTTDAPRDHGHHYEMQQARSRLVNAVLQTPVFGNDAVSLAQAKFGQEVEIIIKNYWTKFLLQRGVDPTTFNFKYAWLAAGSMVRGEMCPFSDIEMMMAVDHKQRASAVFRQNVKGYAEDLKEIEKPFLEMFLGYAKVPRHSRWGLSQYFVMVDTLINPFMVPKVRADMDFLGTPDDLAAFHKKGMQEKTTFVSLSSMDGMGGQDKATGAKALEKIRNRMQKIHSQLGLKYFDSSGITELFRYDDSRVIMSRPGHDDDKRKENAYKRGRRVLQMVNVKKALIRPFHFTVEGLLLYYNLWDTNVVSFADRITRLVNAGKLHPGLGARIKQAMQAGFRLRVLAHIHVGRESDNCWFPGHANVASTEYQLNQHEIPVVRQILKLRQLLWKKLTLWYRDRDNSDALTSDAACTANSPIC